MKQTMVLQLDKRFLFDVSFDGMSYHAQSLDFPKYSTVGKDKYELFCNMEWLIVRLRKKKTTGLDPWISHIA